MVNIQLDHSYELYQSFQELPQEDQLLINSAKEAAHNAYAPYSQFYVGAALRLENGQIIQGNNQENAAYPSGLCAERVAFFSAGSQFPGQKIQSIAIIAYANNDFKQSVRVSPCGDCRQVMAEYENRYAHSIRLIMESDAGKFIATHNVSSLLPFLFSADSLALKK
jgi:cytidine deaminase